jgi:hypothetical protein
MVLYKEICCQRCDCFVDKVITLITSQDSRASKPSNNVFKSKSSSYICQTILNYFCFIPSPEVICCDNDVSSI